MCFELLEATNRIRRLEAIPYLTSWIASVDEGNLIVVYGEVGDGKTWILDATEQAASKDLKVPMVEKAEFETLRREVILKELHAVPPPEVETVLIVDHYDAHNSITGEQTSQPDLRDLAPILRAGYRVVVATRRSPIDPGDELNRQLRKPERAQALGVRTPKAIWLDPWTLDELDAAAASSRSDELRSVVRYLRDNRELVTGELRRPLMLKMIARAIQPISQAPGPPSVAHLYEQYVDWVLTHDWDDSRSNFRGNHKHAILTELAYDIFSGQQGTKSSAYSVSYVRIAQRVMETVSQDPNLRLAAGEERYEWTLDFLYTNHFLRPVGESVHFDVESQNFTFVHPSYYEYFVARGILKQVSRNSSLGVRVEALSEATFRSIILYFVREYWNPTMRQAIESIAQRDLLWTDRLLLLYTMDDSEDYERLIKATDAAYFQSLEHALPNFRSRIVQRAMKYQLVMAGRYSAYDYVEDIRATEEAAETAQERHLLRITNPDVTAQLVHRLNSRNFRAVVPVTVYRIGQMASADAQPALQPLLIRPDTPPELRRLVSEALDRIAARVPTNESQDGQACQEL